MSQITLKQIAERAGTSVGTVDRALNNRGRISPSTKEKIIKIANDIDIKIDNTGDKDIVLLNGEDVSRDIRTKEVTSIVSQISSIIPSFFMKILLLFSNSI